MKSRAKQSVLWEIPKKIKLRFQLPLLLYAENEYTECQITESKVDDSVLMVNTVVLNYFQSSACVSVSFVLNFPWNDSYASNNSREFKLLKFGMAIVVSGSVIYNESCIISRSHIDPTWASVSHKHFSCHNLLWKVMTFSQSISLSLNWCNYLLSWPWGQWVEVV